MYEKMRSRGHEWVKRLTKEEWFAKEINGCVMARDPECFLEMGQPHHERFWFDLAIVSRTGSGLARPHHNICL